MKKNLAPTPPMGWNSWDCYGSAVRENEVRAIAEYMAKNLKSYGWQYVVIDGGWFAPDFEFEGSSKEDWFDEYGRFTPNEDKYPSAKGGKGFKPLAHYIHSLGLKFGIHMLRGIPRKAVAANTKILGSTRHAADIANPESKCPWNNDMFGVDPAKEGAAEYYKSVYRMYADWGVDFVKVDDISCPYHKGEVELVSRAIENSGRDMVLSLSPGETPVEEAAHLSEYANMWRTSPDFWDIWDHLYGAFERCHCWEKHVKANHWPDADMLPLGRIGIRTFEHNVGDRITRFTRDEQYTLMTLWCISRSPLFLGGELTETDNFTLSLITNAEVIEMLNSSTNNRQLYRRGDDIAWTACAQNGDIYLAVFNTDNKWRNRILNTSLEELGLSGTYKVRDLWKNEEIMVTDNALSFKINSHGVRLLRLSKV